MKTTCNNSEINKKALELYNSSNNYDSMNDEKYDSFEVCLKDAEILLSNTASEMINDNYSVKELFAILEAKEVEFNNILKTVLENSTSDYKINIAKNGLKYNSLSTKQAWCMAYEFKNVA